MPTIYKPKKKREYNDYSGKRAKRQKIYNSKRWKDMRITYLMSHPVSEISEWQGKSALAEHVHHIVSFMDVSDEDVLRYAYDYNNLIAVTAEEHWRLHNGDWQNCKSKDEIKARVLATRKS